jgi:hypothetical protein
MVTRSNSKSTLKIMKIILLFAVTIAAVSELIFGTIDSASAATLDWEWNYSGAGITASGTFRSNDTPDPNGFYQITAIAGTRNGVAITGLYRSGNPIPGNAPFTVSNLISPNDRQLDIAGFGYSTADSNYVSPFFASFLQPPVYLEVFSTPPFATAAGFEAEDRESPISFRASLVKTATSSPTH